MNSPCECKCSIKVNTRHCLVVDSSSCRINQEGHSYNLENPLKQTFQSLLKKSYEAMKTKKKLELHWLNRETLLFPLHLKEKLVDASKQINVPIHNLYEHQIIFWKDLEILFSKIYPKYLTDEEL